jgi:hypothetical protein
MVATLALSVLLHQGLDPGALNVKARGDAKATLRELYEDKAKWDVVLDGIGSGADEWLDLAKALYSVSDAGATFELSLGVAEALRKNPQGVLKRLRTDKSDGFDAEDVCTFGWPKDQTPSAIKRRLNEVEDAVRSVQDDDLRSRIDACLANLEVLRKDVKE